MLSSENAVESILQEASKASDLQIKRDEGILDRYKSFLISYIESHEKENPLKIRRRLLALEAILVAVGAGLGFFVIYSGTEEGYKVAIWIGYIALVTVVAVSLRMIPETLELFYLEARQLRLINLAERLAAEVALFDLVGINSAADDGEFIKKVSKFVPSTDVLSERDKGVIRACLENERVFNSSRESNITFPTILFEGDQGRDLTNAVKRLVDLCGYLFAGRDYTAKLYLRSNIDFEGKETEVLVSFAKYPPDSSEREGHYGSSWVKARGNPSRVWTCLESGKSLHVTGSQYGSYYKSMLLICLPGRSGVLALTSGSERAFEGKHDKWLEKSLSTAAKVLAERSLGIGA